jgi:hypothetical protein
MERRGCAITSDSKPLIFDTEWTYREVDNHIRMLLPQPFNYIDEFFRVHESKRSVERPVWVLVSKEHGRLKTVHIDLPTGFDLNRYKGRDRCSVKECNVYVGA